MCDPIRINQCSPEGQYVMIGLTGFTTGFIWSVIAGDADLSTGKGWVRALSGGLGSAATSMSIYSIADAASNDEMLSRDITFGWWGAQSGASFTNWIGRRFNVQGEPEFQAFSIPLNFAASPLTSFSGLTWSLIGAIEKGFAVDVGAHAGMIVVDHDLCPSSKVGNTGAVGHCFKTDNKKIAYHEEGHQVQVSIFGDIGIWGAHLLQNFLGLITGSGQTEWGENRKQMVLESWANDYDKQAREERPTAQRGYEKPVKLKVSTKDLMPDLITLNLQQPRLGVTKDGLPWDFRTSAGVAWLFDVLSLDDLLGFQIELGYAGSDGRHFLDLSTAMRVSIYQNNQQAYSGYYGTPNKAEWKKMYWDAMIRLGYNFPLDGRKEEMSNPPLKDGLFFGYGTELSFRVVPQFYLGFSVYIDHELLNPDQIAITAGLALNVHPHVSEPDKVSLEWLVPEQVNFGIQQIRFGLTEKETPVDFRLMIAASWLFVEDVFGIDTEFGYAATDNRHSFDISGGLKGAYTDSVLSVGLSVRLGYNGILGGDSADVRRAPLKDGPFFGYSLDFLFKAHEKIYFGLRAGMEHVLSNLGKYALTVGPMFTYQPK